MARFSGFLTNRCKGIRNEIRLWIVNVFGHCTGNVTITFDYPIANKWYYWHLLLSNLRIPFYTDVLRFILKISPRCFIRAWDISANLCPSNATPLKMGGGGGGRGGEGKGGSRWSTWCSFWIIISRCTHIYAHRYMVKTMDSWVNPPRFNTDFCRVRYSLIVYRLLDILDNFWWK